MLFILILMRILIIILVRLWMLVVRICSWVLIILLVINDRVIRILPTIRHVSFMHCARVLCSLRPLVTIHLLCTNSIWILSCSWATSHMLWMSHSSWHVILIVWWWLLQEFIRTWWDPTTFVSFDSILLLCIIVTVWFFLKWQRLIEFLIVVLSMASWW